MDCCYEARRPSAKSVSSFAAIFNDLRVQAAPHLRDGTEIPYIATAMNPITGTD
jgi:hypothetical protein